jgi:hypothetical protein
LANEYDSIDQGKKLSNNEGRRQSSPSVSWITENFRAAREPSCARAAARFDLFSRIP